MSKPLFFIMSAIFCLQSAVSTAQQVANVADTVRFEVAGHKIIIPVSIDGKAARFIVDTGGRNIIVSDSAEYYGMKILGNHAVSDVNQAQATFARGNVNDLKIGSFLHTSVSEFLAVPNNPYFRSLNVAGALGGEAFANVCVTFDMPRKQIIINYPYRPKGVSRADGIPMDRGTGFYTRPVINIAGRDIRVSFDTGLKGFLNLDSRDMQQFNGNPTVTVEAEGEGFTSVGITGIEGAKNNALQKVNISELTIGKKTFLNTGTLSEPGPGSIVGIDLLDYGNVMIDYPRGLFFFFPFEPSPTDMRRSTLEWNVKIMPVKEKFEITAVLGITDLKVGERVWRIGSTDMSGFPSDELAIMELLDQTDGRVTLLVGSDAASLREVEISKI